MDGIRTLLLTPSPELRGAMGELAHRVVDVIAVPQVEANRALRVFPSTVPTRRNMRGIELRKEAFERFEDPDQDAGRHDAVLVEVEKEENVGATECQVKLVR